MYGYGSYYEESFFESLGWVGIVSVIILIVVVVAFIVATSLFINLAKKKGYEGNQEGWVGAGVLWFIGIFATPLAAGLYVLMLPDKSGTATPSSDSPASEELPKL